jgi:hypothetical protein
MSILAIALKLWATAMTFAMFAVVIGAPFVMMGAGNHPRIEKVVEVSFVALVASVVVVGIAGALCVIWGWR